MVWITFATDAKVIFLSKENPAGRAMEDLMAYFGNLVPDLKSIPSNECPRKRET